MDKRSILAIILSLAVLYIYQIYFVKPPVQDAQKKPVSDRKTETVAEKPKDQVPAPAAPEGRVSASTIVSLQQKKGLEEKEVSIETDEYSAIFTSRGAGLKSFKLKKYRKTIDKDSDLIELVNVNPQRLPPLSLSFSGSDFSPPEEALYDVRLAAPVSKSDHDPGQLIFSLEYPGMVRIEKIYRFSRDTYNLDLELKVNNLSGNAINQYVSLNWREFVDPKKEADQYGHEGPVYIRAKSIEREEVKSITKAKTVGPDIPWGGFETKYFIAAMIPQNPSLTTLEISKDNDNTVVLSVKTPKIIIPSGQAGASNFSLFLGPKDYDILKARNVGLEKSIDFGDWLQWLAIPLLICLKFLRNNLIHNYGIAIIILTTIIKIIFWPLGNKSYKSMKEMQKLQPKIAELREKYKDDKARISQEMMALYKAHKVNPMGGCLPMLIQIPVFFGLYKTLLYAIELRHSPFFWWIQDLSAKDPYYITPIIMGGTMFIQQKMTPPAGDPMQAKIMLFMPLIFTFMFLNFPSGLVLYWLFNNIISIGQQYYINKINS